ncbi:MAG: sugar nucleotide-binding protein [Deltaproteobacteria bacterium]|nr:sugar nucleotide-binding protein [Deltaproteobacteria bacterium]
MRVLVTGGSGFAGLRLVQSLTPSHDVSFTFLTHPVLIRGAVGHRLDLRDRAATRELVRALAPHAILHLASADRDRATIVEGTGHLLRACEATRSRFIFVSSDLVFDGDRGEYGEDAEPRPILPYGRAKREAELQVLGAGGAIVRPSLLYAVDALPPWARAVDEAVRAGRAFPCFVDEYRSPLWVEDLVRLLGCLLEHGEQGIWHCGGPDRLSRYDLARALAPAWGWDLRYLVAGQQAEGPGPRPADCSLVSDKAERLLKRRFHRVSEVVGGAASWGQAGT